MKRSAGAALVLALLVALPVSAQSLYFGGGISAPTSDFSDYAGSGIAGTLGVNIAEIAPALGVYVDGFLSMNDHDFEGDETMVYSTMAGLGYDFGGEEATTGVYAFGQAGMMWHKYTSEANPSFDTTESGFGFGAGAGVYFPLGGVNGWLEGRFMSASIEDATTALFAVMVGINIGG